MSKPVSYDERIKCRTLDEWLLELKAQQEEEE